MIPIIRLFILVVLLLLGVTGTLSASGAGSLAPRAETAPAPFNREQLIADLARDLGAHFNLEGELQLELPRTWATPTAVASHWAVEIVEYPSLASSAMLLRIRVVGDGAVVADLSVVVRAAHIREVWIARQPIALGAIFDPAALDTRRVDLFRERESLPTSAGDRSFIFTRGISAGRPLVWRDLARRPLVRKGDLVEVSVNEGALSVTMKGLALESGAQGDIVTVRNPQSRKDFVAVVTHENRVQVRL
jgi:flagella basal body P-ring formation protein FlgA